MKLVDRHLSQLTVNDGSADRQFGVNLALSSTASPPPYPLHQTNGTGRRCEHQLTRSNYARSLEVMMLLADDRERKRGQLVPLLISGRRWCVLSPAPTAEEREVPAQHGTVDHQTTQT